MTQTIDDSLLDDEWLAAPTKRSRLRVVLAGVLVASLCFLGGMLVQKQWGTESTGTAAGPGGLPAGFPGAGGALPDGASGFPGAGSGQQGTDSDAADDTDAVIGKVVEIHGDTWIVEDLGGERHTINVGDDTDVVREQHLGPADVKQGDTVNVTGTTVDGDLNADEVTLR